MSSTYKKYRKLVFTSITITVIVLVLNITYLSGDHYIKKIYHITILPFQIYSIKILEKTLYLNQKFEKAKNLESKLIETQKQLLHYKDMNEQLKLILKKENQNIKDILNDLSYTKTKEIVPANIISKDPQNLFNTIIINKGSNDGIKVNMPVIAFNKEISGLVGYIYNIGPHSSKILTILDHRCHVSVIIDETRDIGLMKGQSPIKDKTIINYIDIKLENLEKKSIVTSGYSDKYPKGIYIGTIIGVNKKRYGLFQKLIVKPNINFFKIEHVFIIKKTKNN